MRDRKKGVAKTSESLLAAASALFAEKGYRDTTVAEICERAGANVAAVNYHFGNKETLYVETWRHCFIESVRAHPPDGGVSDDAPPEERLRGQVRALIGRIVDKTNREFLIVRKEMANPTGLLREVMQKELLPLHERTLRVVGELLGPCVSAQLIRFCATSIISQSIDPVALASGPGGKRKGMLGPLRTADIAAYADHVVTFSLAGMGAVRADSERKHPDAGQRFDGGAVLERE